MRIEKALPGVQKNVLLKNYTTFKIGGPAKYFFVAEKKEKIIDSILVAKKNNLSFFIFGGGSNLLVSDKGYNGIVIKIKSQKLKVKNKKIFAEAGTLLGQLVKITLKRNLTGFEWAISIPGTVGGAVSGNTGAFGKSMKDIVEEVEVFDVKNQKIKILKNKNCKFRYRDSAFKHDKNLVILSAALQLQKGSKKEIKNKIEKYLNYRKERQPLNFPSAGSVFKNFTPYRPALYIKLAEIKRQIIRLEGGAGAGPEELRELKKFQKTGTIPAAWLIEKCGLKGKRVGNVKISEKNANFIINLGQGKAKDVKRLINLIKKMVKSKFGIRLEEEIQILE